MSCCSFFSRGKNKSAGRDDGTNGQTAPAESKPTVVHEPPSAANAPAKPGAVAQPVKETPAQPEPEPEPETKEPPRKDLWQDALQQLPQAKQDALKKRGFDKLSSGSMASNVKDLVGLVNKKQEECESKFWRVSVGGEDIVLRDYTTSIIGWLGKAGDIAIQFAPPQASLPWSLIKSVMEIPVHESEQMAALLATTERIVRITSRGQVYEQVYLSHEPDAHLDAIQKNLESALVQIYTSSLDLLAESDKLFSAGTARRTLEALVNPGKMSGSLTELGAQEDEMLRDIQACESKRSAEADDRMIKMLEAFNDPLTRIDKGISYLLEHMDEREHIKMLEWISPIPFGKHHDDVKEKRTPGTGQWLLQRKEFRDWEETKSSVLFWLQGSAGTGKTYLTSTVIDRVQGQISHPPKDESFAFFYCDKEDKARSQPLAILQSFVRQLSTSASNPESIQSKLRNDYKEAQEKGTNFRLEQCKEQILASLNIYQKSTIVIDALDECDPDAREDLIEALNSFLSKSTKPLKIFISSRLDPDIARELESSHNVGISASENQEDIKKFLDVELDKFARKAAFMKRLKPDVMAKLLERCEGMFQWAVLQVHQISKCINETGVWKRLENLPKGLQDAYDEVWTEMESRGEPAATLAKRALLWVMAASEPMTSDEILSAIRIDSNGDMFPLADKINEQALLSVCNNFLTIDSQLKVWRFPHLSVREYLEKKEGWSLPQAHYYAASVCLSYFINTYERDDLGLDADSEAKPEEHEESGESDDGYGKLHQFHIYMRHCWPQHVHGAKDPGTTALSSLLKTFLGSPNASSVQYRRWLRCSKEDISRSNSQHYRNTQDIISELFPEGAAIFAMCGLSLDTILSDWWESAEIDCSCVNSRNHNLLGLAVRAHSVPICKRLVERGMDVNAQIKGYDHGSALAEACFSTPEIVKYLLGAGADVNMSLKSGQFGSALATAAYEGVDIGIVKLLVEGGADINKPLEHGNYGSALAAAGAASEYVDDDVLAYLVEAGADVNMPLEHGQFGSALAATAWARIFSRLDILFQAGVDVNMILKGRDFGSALAIVAAFQNGDRTIEKMLEGGADPNLQHPVGRYGSPLIAAAAFGQIESVECLIDAGADVNLKFEGLPYATALQAAKADMSQEEKAWLLRRFNGNEVDAEEFAYDWEEQKPDVVELLQQHGATD